MSRDEGAERDNGRERDVTKLAIEADQIGVGPERRQRQRLPRRERWRLGVLLV